MQRVRACAKDSLLICRCAGLPSLAAGSELAAFPPEGPPETIDLSGTVRDVRRDHPDFNASPFGGLGHDTGSIAAGLGAGARPTFVGDGLKVVSQWHDAASRPIAPDVSAVGGGEPGPASNAEGRIRGRNTRARRGRLVGRTPPAGGHRRRLVHGEGVQPWQAHTQPAASGNGAAPA